MVPELPPEFLRLRQEVEIAAAEDDEFLRQRRLPAYHQQAARDVIDAVAVRVQWHHAVGMVEQADVIGQPLQVTEWRVRAPQRTEAVALGRSGFGKISTRTRGRLERPRVPSGVQGSG